MSTMRNVFVVASAIGALGVGASAALGAGPFAGPAADDLGPSITTDPQVGPTNETPAVDSRINPTTISAGSAITTVTAASAVSAQSAPSPQSSPSPVSAPSPVTPPSPNSPVSAQSAQSAPSADSAD